MYFFIRSLPIPLPTLKSGRTSGLLALQQRRERLVNQKGQNGDQQTLYQGEGQIEHDEGQKQLVAEGEKPVISAHQILNFAGFQRFGISQTFPDGRFFGGLTGNRGLSAFSSQLGLAIFYFHDTMGLQIKNGGATTWPIRSVPLASAAALAQMHVPWVLFPRVTIVM